VSQRYLLDTNIVSDLVRDPNGRVAAAIARVGAAAVSTSIIVAAELRFGAEKKRSVQLANQIETILKKLPVLPLEPPVDEFYAKARVALEAAGTPISGNDMLIAAQALNEDMTVVTDNVREFSRVPGLKIENWLRP
jgi:tRNA(fMet)-specific endonuclease VapC